MRKQLICRICNTKISKKDMLSLNYIPLLQDYGICATCTKPLYGTPLLYRELEKQLKKDYDEGINKFNSVLDKIAKDCM